MDSKFELKSPYELASEEVSEIESKQWPKNPPDIFKYLRR